MRFNYKKIKGLGRIKHRDKPITVGELSSSKKLHVYLGRDKRNYLEMLKRYIGDYDRIRKDEKLMSVDTAKKLYRGGRTGKDLWIAPQFADGLLGAGSYYANDCFHSDKSRPRYFYSQIIKIHDELKPTVMSKSKLRIYLVNQGNTITAISKRFPGTPTIFNLRRMVKIYNRFHPDDPYPLNEHYVVSTLPVGSVHVLHHGDFQFYYFYDDNAQKHRARLATAVNNPNWQMSRKTASKVVNNISDHAVRGTAPRRVSLATARKISLQKTVQPYQVNDELIKLSKRDRSNR